VEADEGDGRLLGGGAGSGEQVPHPEPSPPFAVADRPHPDTLPTPGGVARFDRRAAASIESAAMSLGPTDEARLRVFALAELARRTLERGLGLNAPEAIALICDEMHLAARAGLSYDEVVEAGRRALRPEQVIEGVGALAAEIRVEVLLKEGTRLIVLRDALGSPDAGTVGAIVVADDGVELAPGRRRIALVVTNTSTRPVRVSSHYPFWRVNARLEFDRRAARGFRLDVPAGASVRWSPGERREVTLVAFGGEGGSG
jgi:urease subunit gamma/beta